MKPYSKLRGRICEKFRTQGAFAEAIGISVSTLSAKLSGKVEWTRIEMKRTCDVLDIPLALVGDYFFTD